MNLHLASFYFLFLQAPDCGMLQMNSIKTPVNNSEKQFAYFIVFGASNQIFLHPGCFLPLTHSLLISYGFIASIWLWFPTFLSRWDLNCDTFEQHKALVSHKTLIWKRDIIGSSPDLSKKPNVPLLRASCALNQTWTHIKLFTEHI